jgi:hypothetical protein
MGSYHEPILVYVRCMEPILIITLPLFFFANRAASQYFSKPIWQELLPPMLPPPHQKPYTLLLSIDDLLVTSTWDVSSLALSPFSSFWPC